MILGSSRYTALAAMFCMCAVFGGCSAKPKSNPGGDPAKPQPKPRDEAKFALGKEVYLSKAQPSCSTCHTLADAQSQGTVGPNLDSISRSKDAIVRAVSGGLGLMPAQSEVLSPQEIEAVAYYVVHARKVR